MLVGFDIETAQLAPQDRSASYKLGITCAAVSFQDGIKHIFYPGFGEVSHVWLSNSPFAVTYTSQPGEHGGTMSLSDLQSMTRLLDKIHKEGHGLVTWNGAGFDFRVLYEELEGDAAAQAIIANLAMEHLDVMFQVLCIKGYPVGLEACAKEMIMRSKVGMHGEEAVAEWAKGIQERAKVIEYVQGDADLTVETASAIEQHSQVRWITKAGKLAIVRINALQTVRRCMDYPLPDTSWMNSPLDRAELVAWANTADNPSTPPLPQMPLF
jgi:hypothetical protein